MAASRLCPSRFIAPTSSLSRAHLHTAGIWLPSQLLVASLLGWLCREWEGPFTVQPFFLAHLVVKRQGCVSNQSLQGQGPGVREPLDFHCDTGLDVYPWERLQCAQFGSVCRNLCLLFLLDLADPTLLLWKSELNSPKNLEGHLGFAQSTQTQWRFYL